MRKRAIIFILIVICIAVRLTGCATEKLVFSVSGMSIFSNISVEEGWIMDQFSYVGDIWLGEVPELGCATGGMSGDDYICYKDILILGELVYQKKNGCYIKSQRTLYDMLGVEEGKGLNRCKQYRNLIVTTSQKHDEFLIYDMDMDSLYTYPSKGDDAHILFWYIYDDGIYYCRHGWNEIRKINLMDGEEKVIYSRTEEKNSIRQFLIRDDGAILCDWYGTDSGYWLVESDGNGGWEEKKIGEYDEDRWKYVSLREFNRYGLILVGGFWYPQNGFGDERLVIRDNGEEETINFEMKGACNLYLDNGYLLSNIDEYYSQEWLEDCEPLRHKAYTVTFYDYEGNELGTYELIKDIKILQDYYLRKLIYRDGKITAFYVQEVSDELYISQVEVDF